MPPPPPHQEAREAGGRARTPQTNGPGLGSATKSLRAGKVTQPLLGPVYAVFQTYKASSSVPGTQAVFRK